MSLDATVSWPASPSSNATGYTITFSQNGTALPAISVPRTSALDIAGYTLDFANATGVTPAGGDIIGASLVVNDATDNLNSASMLSTPPTVTEPVAPVAPALPASFTLALS